MKLARFNEDASQEETISLKANEADVAAVIDTLNTTRSVILWANEASYLQAIRVDGDGDYCMLNYGNDLNDCFECIQPAPLIANVKKAFIDFLNGRTEFLDEFKWGTLINHYEDDAFDVKKEIAIILSKIKPQHRSSEPQVDEPPWIEALKDAVSIVSKHKETLQRKRSQLRYKGDYGLYENDKWEKEVNGFWENLVSPTIKSLQNPPAYAGDHLAIVNAVLDNMVSANSSTVDVDDLDPIEYERFCAQQLEESGWKTRLTANTGDHGTDIVATKNGVSIAIQCKKYSNPVGNAAVQEIIAGKAFEGTQFAAVVSNISYTSHAIQLAQKASVLLLHHSDLKNLHTHASLNNAF
jgi:restriction system protein